MDPSVHVINWRTKPWDGVTHICCSFGSWHDACLSKGIWITEETLLWIDEAEYSSPRTTNFHEIRNPAVYVYKVFPWGGRLRETCIIAVLI